VNGNVRQKYSGAGSVISFHISRSLGVGLGGFHDKSLVNVWDHTTAGNSSLDKSVKLFVTTDCELQVAGSDTLNFKVFASVTSQFKHFSSEVLKDGSRVNCGCSTNATASIYSGL
jgi:hypothetical protein